MIIEILFSEVCGLYGDFQNPKYLEATLPDAQFIYTELTQTPYFVDHDVDMLYIGTMSEEIQRRVIHVLMPYKTRIEELIANNTLILATGNAGEVFMKEISYVTENITAQGLGILDLTVKTDLFRRRNGKVIGETAGITVVGFQSQFSAVYGDNSENYFIQCERGVGLNSESKLEGVRINNFIYTQLIGPLLPLNPLFTEYLVELMGGKATAAYKEAAMDAYEQRIKEFRDPGVAF